MSVALLCGWIYYDLHVENREEIKMSEDLKPCLCGHDAKIARLAKRWVVFCSCCGAEVVMSTQNAITTCQVTKQELKVIEKWNKRND